MRFLIEVLPRDVLPGGLEISGGLVWRPSIEIFDRGLVKRFCREPLP